MTNESETSNSVPQLNNVTMNPEHSQETDADYYALKKWELGFLRRECVNLGLEAFYNKYMARVQRSYLSIFVVLQTFVSVAHVIVIVTGEQVCTLNIRIFFLTFFKSIQQLLFILT